MMHGESTQELDRLVALFPGLGEPGPVVYSRDDR